MAEYFNNDLLEENGEYTCQEAPQDPQWLILICAATRR